MAARPCYFSVYLCWLFNDAVSIETILESNDRVINGRGAAGGIRIDGIEPAPVPLCPPHIHIT
jgi:hypothetical protein